MWLKLKQTLKHYSHSSLLFCLNYYVTLLLPVLGHLCCCLLSKYSSARGILSGAQCFWDTTSIGLLENVKHKVRTLIRHTLSLLFHLLGYEHFPACVTGCVSKCNFQSFTKLMIYKKRMMLKNVWWLNWRKTNKENKQYRQNQCGLASPSCVLLPKGDESGSRCSRSLQNNTWEVNHGVKWISVQGRKRASLSKERFSYIKMYTYLWLSFWG